MLSGSFSSSRIWPMCRLFLGVLAVCAAATFCARAAQQAAPDATPQIQNINPNHAAPGAHIAVTITGSNFSAAAAASSTSNAIHIESLKQISNTQLEVELSVSDSVQPGAASLIVSNPNGSAAVAEFSIVAPAAVLPQNSEAPQPSSPPAAAAPAEPATPQAPATSPSTPTPDGSPAPLDKRQAPAPSPTTPPTAEVTPASPQPPAAPAAPPAPAEAPGPEVATVTPARLGQGFDIDLRVAGKNFVKGTKVSFANPGVRVLGVVSSSTTQITLHIKVAGDAPTGKTSLFVINPDDNEVEVPIEIALKGTLTATPSIPAAPGSTPTDDPSYIQRFEAFHLASPTEIFHVHGKVKGALVISGGTLKYQEDNQTLVNISLGEIKEVKTAGIGGVNVKLNSGKTHHFAAASLKGSDARIIVEAIQKALPAPTAE